MRALAAALVLAWPPHAGPERASARLLVASGGRVAWYKGQAHDLIAYDAIADAGSRNTEVFVIRPDGGGRSCVTCAAATPKGFVGQPAWHPDGEHVVIQAESRGSRHTPFNHVSWGFDNDLWIVRKDGKGAERIWTTPANHAALHPHFSADGKMLIFAERIPTGKSRLVWRGRTPGGENHWDGWRIHVAEVRMDLPGERKLAGHRTIRPNGAGFYETHGFAPDGRILYSFTPGGKPYVDDCYSARLDGTGSANLTGSSGTWEEHGQYSPDGRLFAFISSRVDESLRFPRARAADLVSELFVRRGGEEPVQLTDMNERKRQKTVVSDFDWDRTGTLVAFQVASLTTLAPPEIWILSLTPATAPAHAALPVPPEQGK